MKNEKILCSDDLNFFEPIPGEIHISKEQTKAFGELVTHLPSIANILNKINSNTIKVATNAEGEK